MITPSLNNDHNVGQSTQERSDQNQNQNRLAPALTPITPLVSTSGSLPPFQSPPLSMRDADYTDRVSSFSTDISSGTRRVSIANNNFRYPDEKIDTVVLDDSQVLGQSVALEFLRWVQKNPEGVIALPTGKTPEPFIRSVRNILENWTEEKTSTLIEQCGLEPDSKPDLSKLSFVQLDEYYPMEPSHPRSFAYFIDHYYFNAETGLGLDREKALLMSELYTLALPEGQSADHFWREGVDTTLLEREPIGEQEAQQKNVLSEVKQFCQRYEKAIEAKGGIGLFLGGIGPDGHIAFNIRGTDPSTPTHLVSLNYESCAAAATDLGGIRRGATAVTIGLGTITANPECRAMIIAAGEAKSEVIRDAVRLPDDPSIPSHALRTLPNATVFATKGAASLLDGRRVENQIASLSSASNEQLNQLADEAIMRWSLTTGRPIAQLCIEIDGGVESNESVENKESIKIDRLVSALLSATGRTLEEQCARTLQTLEAAVEKGLALDTSKRYLHTEPHDDDIMLGIWPKVSELKRADSTQHVCCLTAGFNSVSNEHMLKTLQQTHSYATDAHSEAIQALWNEGYFSDDSKAISDINCYVDDLDLGGDGEPGAVRRMIRDLVGQYGLTSYESMTAKVEALVSYFEESQPGGVDRKDIQQLKGKRREQDSDTCWRQLGLDEHAVHHHKLSFYKGGMFDAPPDADDVDIIVNLLKQVNPDVVSVALDPEASGPDTHYKVLQGVSAALHKYVTAFPQKSESITVWGYRNVWNRWDPWDRGMVATPVDRADYLSGDRVFKSSYATQRAAAFPSPKHDGPFSEITQQVQIDHLKQFKTLLGEAYFINHDDERVRDAVGFMLHVELTVDELGSQSKLI